MKRFGLYSILLVAFMICSAFTMKKGDTKNVYMVGVSASFSDSLIYFTDVQLVDSVELDANKLLPQRQQYSYQLKTYLEAKTGMTNRTCFIYFDTKKNKLEKTIKKMKADYQKDGKSIIRQVDPEFKFTKAETYE
ncbi:MAG: hypothetical protein E7095_02720 [Bacteroides sp.]|nr:hypothetical protein [Bacteroides sp.]